MEAKGRKPSVFHVLKQTDDTPVYTMINDINSVFPETSPGPGSISD